MISTATDVACGGLYRCKRRSGQPVAPVSSGLESPPPDSRGTSCRLLKVAQGKESSLSQTLTTSCRDRPRWRSKHRPRHGSCEFHWNGPRKKSRQNRISGFRTPEYESFFRRLRTKATLPRRARHLVHAYDELHGLARAGDSIGGTPPPEPQGLVTLPIPTFPLAASTPVHGPPPWPAALASASRLLSIAGGSSSSRRGFPASRRSRSRYG